MSARRIVGIVLVIVGMVALLWGGFSFTRQKTVLDAGPLQVKTEKHERIPLPPAAGAVALVAGVLLLVVPSRRHA